RAGDPLGGIAIPLGERRGAKRRAIDADHLPSPLAREIEDWAHRIDRAERPALRVPDLLEERLLGQLALQKARDDLFSPTRQHLERDDDPLGTDRLLSQDPEERALRLFEGVIVADEHDPRSDRAPK